MLTLDVFLQVVQVSAMAADRFSTESAGQEVGGHPYSGQVGESLRS